MENLDQRKTPYLDALKKYIKENNRPFDVPGHHMGNATNDFKKYVGEMTFKVDVNAPRGMDNLNHPSGVIKEAEALMADAYKAKESFFLINGTSSGIIAMIMVACKRKEKIIMPRNCHKSAINALVLSGAIPIFIMPDLDVNLEIANQPSVEDYVKAMDKHPDAKAIFVINPTYFGAVCDLKKITEEAHKRDMVVLVDEAHGAHFAFNQYGPYSAMECNADMSAVSLHKTCGSLTQSSVLLLNTDKISHYDVMKTLSAINSTSPSTILLASLDAARKEMAIHGQQNMNDIVNLANYARKEISRIQGFNSPGRDYFLKHGVFDYDDTKLVIEIGKVGLNGFQLYNMLKDEYNIQMELAEAYTLLGIVAIGSKKEHIDALISALKDISNRFYSEDFVFPKRNFNIHFPKQVLRPRSAYHAPLKKVLLEDSMDKISKEAIMVYPPGIPLIVPGEVFSKDVIERIKYYKSVGATILSDYDDGYVSTVDEAWPLMEEYRYDLE